MPTPSQQARQVPPDDESAESLQTGGPESQSMDVDLVEHNDNGTLHFYHS